MTCYCIEQWTGKYFKRYGFFSFGRNLSNIYRKKNKFHAATKTVIDALETASKKVAHKAAEATRDFIANENAETIPPKNLRDFEESLNDWTASKFLTRKWIEINGLPGGQCSVNKNITFKSPILWSNLCDYSHVYIVVKRRII